jgi:GT2 family glycosyltransferase
MVFAERCEAVGQFIRSRIEIALVRRSPFFDAAWYLKTYPDVVESGIDPARHYALYGAREGRAPNAEASASIDILLDDTWSPDWTAFCERFRLGRAAAAEIARTRRSPFFDAAWYLETYPDVAESGITPARHYALYGWKEGRNPGPRFHTRFYLEQLAAAGEPEKFPLKHYAIRGAALGLSTLRPASALARPLPTGPLRAPTDLAKRFRIGVAAHVFYPEMAAEMAAAIARIPAPVALLLSTDTEDKAAILRRTFESLEKRAEITVTVVPNRGRDVAPMLIAHAGAILDCDLVLHIHSKRSPYGSHMAGWFDHCLAHLLHSPLYVDMILRAFDEDAALGVIHPPAFPANFPHMTWSGMQPDAARMLTRIGLDDALLEAFPLDFPAGTMMWFRPAALKQFFEAAWDWDNFPDEDGQTDGTTAHVFERLIFYVAAANGFRWQAVRPALRHEGAALRILAMPSSPVSIPAGAPGGAAPLVSIVIPVFNQWEMTAVCLRAIVEHTDPVATPYEVVLADDGSTDGTVEAARTFPDLRVVRGAANLGFLGNVNRAAAEARGRYLMLLNNDTQVQPGWLEALLAGFAQRPDAAVVGAKLIYPDGVLQEVGGIIWQDGTGVNYGRGARDFLAPGYTYFRETDYVSGAAILVDGDFWRARGGFDPRFSPAYYEDTDLCFAARAAGRTVWVHPGAMVIHFEGRSHGTDITSGVKRHQEINRGRFVEKWASVLADHHPKGLLRARERTEGRTVIAVIDWEVPEYDRHAGGRYVWDYLNLLLDSGYGVKFLACHLGDPRQRAIAQELRNRGVEVCIPDAFLEETDWSAWLTAHVDNLDAVLLSRPRVTDLHLRTCRGLGLRTLYLCHDLHGLREQREAATKGDAAMLARARRTAAHERDLIRQMDFTFTPSAHEEAMIRRDFGVTSVGVLPLCVLRQAPAPRAEIPVGMDLLFVGSMVHGPNPDAVSWFLDEIWPKVRDECPAARFHVVGSGAPQTLLDKADDTVLFHGAVAEDVLESLYREARVSVAPLRFGAGVKGKVIEAMRLGTPVVGTSVALEGIEDIETVIEPVDTADDFAAQLQRVLSMDAIEWSAISMAQSNHVWTHFNDRICLSRLATGIGHGNINTNSRGA